MKTDKSLGQHWLIDEQAVRGIVKSIKNVGMDDLIEIGPGLGVLTAPLLEEGFRVYAIELDARLQQYLKESDIGGAANFTLIEGSAIKIRYDALSAKQLLVVGNIPYNITKPILQHIADQSDVVPAARLLMQKEVVDRLTSRKSSVLQMAICWRYDCHGGVIIEPESFDPPPKVRSQLLEMTRLSVPVVDANDYESYMRWVKIGFAAKRKKLIKNLSAQPHISPHDASTMLTTLGIDANVRAEELSPRQWASLARLLEAIPEVK